MTAYVKVDNRKKSEFTRVWMKAIDKFRIEQNAGAQKIITIANGRDVWEVRTLTNDCFHSVEKPEKVLKIGKQTLQAVNLLDAFKKQGGKRVGEAKVGGVSCTVYRRTDKNGMKHSLWVMPNGRLRRVASEGIQRGAIGLGEPILTHDLEQRADIKWLDARNLEEALFRPPAGMKVTERAPSG